MIINRIAIIGLGSIGRRHIRILKEIRPEIEVTLVRSGKGGDWEEENLAKQTVSSISDAIQEKIQAAIIATPANMHLKQAVKLAQKGIHLLVEKPLSLRIDGVDKLIAEIQRDKIVSMVGYVLRYDPAANLFKELFDKWTVGKPLHARVECGSDLPEWRPNQDYRKSVSAKSELGGGVLLELSHELDYIRWFFGDMKSVFANIQNSGTLDIDVEDSVDMIFESQHGFPISVHLDFNTRNTRRKCIASCSNGDLTWDAIDNKVIWQPAEGIEEVEMYENDRNYVYREQLKHFFDCIENKTQPSVSLEDGLAVLNMIESAKKSHKIGKKVEIA